MKHFASAKFWDAYETLPIDVQATADSSYARLRSDPHHPSLHLKKVGAYWSVRIGRRHRALAVAVNDGLLWFWIGTHADYDKIIG